MSEIALLGVAVSFGPVEALRGVDVSVRSGEVVMLAGPNGAGKSTLLRVLLGLVRANRGELSVDGVARKVDNAFKRRIAYLPEAVAFAENLSGRQVLRFFAGARGVRRARVDEVLARVGLWAARRRSVRGYSRGMRQRLGLGLAILSDPELLILDEPTGGLDQEGVGLLWSILAEWREKQRMVLMSSHDLTLLERRVDRVCVFQDGRITAAGPPEALRELAALPVRVSFALDAGSPQADGLAAAIAAWGRAATVRRSPDALVLEVAPEALLALLDLRAGFPGAVVRVRVEEAGMDQVYESLLTRGTA